MYRWVDEIITDAPWVITEDYINLHKIDFVAHDALPYSDASGQAADVYDFVSFDPPKHTLYANVDRSAVAASNALPYSDADGHCRCS